MTKGRTKPKTADIPLPGDLTDAFIVDLMGLVSQDTSSKGQYLARMLLTKYTSSSKEEASDRRTRAIRKWLDTEDINKATNLRLLTWGSSSVDVLPGISSMRFFGKVREIVANVLPWTPSLSIAYCGFSGGASTSKGRRDSHPAVKFLDKADVTRPAYALFNDVNRGTRWAEHFAEPGLEPRFVNGNVMFTVPKNSEIDRCACKEPDLNMFLQKGLGNQIRSCLKRVGIDLNDQAINRELARIGSIDRSLMTLDLSSASDSVCTELVRLVLPPDWFYYLDLVRSPVTTIDDELHENEMFSSMGNGFTFELESLLFYAITRATAYFGGYKGRISVYGDDIIAPAGMFNDLVSTLAFCGFRTNESKSFHDGSFRESCGGHWDDGSDVTPFFIRGPFRVLSDLILTLNQLTSWSSREIGVVDPHYEGLLRRYWQYVPEQLWGGSDLTSRTSLVTGDRPRSELTYPVKDIESHHLGGLLLWLFQTLERSTEGCLFVTRTTTPSFARIRRRRFVDWREGLAEHDVPLFLNLGETLNVEAMA